ncbi:MAG: glycosyltransferase family 2 protein [Candidatus Omnitrophica bacterium]|nr:glycosyltransferase family 2 protein [Candidatus Omnitrophota bacterium]
MKLSKKMNEKSEMPLVSIVTPTLNNMETIRDTLDSIRSQTYKNIEHILVDGGSTDGTLDIIRCAGGRKVVVELKKGIFGAFNRGIIECRGEIIGILNADDVYAENNVIAKVVQRLGTSNYEACWGDLVYVNEHNLNWIIRYWKSSELRMSAFEDGWMPPHPTFFVKRTVYDQYGLFREDLRIAADYEFILRTLYKHKIKSCYIPEVLVKMRFGGNSNKNLANLIIKNIEDFKICKLSGIKNPLRAVFLKNMSKALQFFYRK